MNSPSSDSPDLTAYALGELSGTQARDIHDLLANCPAASFELEQVEAVTEALRQGAPIPQLRLNPEQRHAVLYPSASHLQRQSAPATATTAPALRPAKFRRRATSSVWPALTAFAKAAAVITVAAVAFTLGRKTSGPQPSNGVHDVALTKPETTHNTVVEEKLPFPVITPRTEIVHLKPLATETQSGAGTGATAETVEKQDVAVAVTSPSQEMSTEAAAAQVPQTAESAKTVVADANSNGNPGTIAGNSQGKPGQTAGKPASPVSIAAIGITPSPRSESFINAIRKPNDQSELRPAKIRPQPVKGAKNGGAVFASPMKGNAGNAAKDSNNTRNRPTDLFIHSWRADVMTCPWNETNRLLRVVIQLPADQPAVLGGEHGYGLNIAFEPNHVREYRILCERNQPATELRSAGTHVIWYEFQPNGPAESVRGNGKPIATVTLPGSRFTTPAVDLFDGSKLRVLDRGITWQNAREDFAFESSVVGFGMLLRGTPETAKLNHQLVLDLATRFKGKDPAGERARFIRLVQEAKHAAGL